MLRMVWIKLHGIHKIHFGATWKRKGFILQLTLRTDFLTKLWRELWAGWPLNTGYGMYKILFGGCWGRRAVQRDNIHPEHLKPKYEIYTASDWNVPCVLKCQRWRRRTAVSNTTPRPPTEAAPLEVASHIRNFMWHVSGWRAPAGVYLVMVNDSLKQYRAGQLVYSYWI